MKTKDDVADPLQGLAASNQPVYTGIFAEQGTRVSGFVSTGKQYCGDCIHKEKAICYHPAVMTDPDLPDMPDGTPAEERKQEDGGIKVDLERECCRFVNVEE